jgi:uracil-DNA glycosylase
VRHAGSVSKIRAAARSPGKCDTCRAARGAYYELSVKTRSDTGAEEFVPARHTLPTLRRAAADCHGCSLWQQATQTVFGEGTRSAEIMLVGEQPGNDEDLAGKPFVGPAGRLLDEALVEAGIDRKRAYVTNAVKHFKWEPRGKRRIHKRPGAGEISACRPWLQAELDALTPTALICLGAIAAQSLLGREFRVTEQRGRLLSSELAKYVLATVHPASLLRLPTPEERKRERARFVEDLKVIARAVSAGAARAR